MIRKLILTPLEHSSLTVLDELLNHTKLVKDNYLIDIPHFIFSALTMAGVDKILSSQIILNTNTKLIEKIDSKTFSKDWSKSCDKVNNMIKPYVQEEKLDLSTQTAINKICYKISQLLYAMETNSGILTLLPFDMINKTHLPIELSSPFDMLYSSIETQNANLPVLKLDIEKKGIKKLIDVLESIEYNNYKEAQREIELNQNLSVKTIRSIEKAGKDLYYKNSKLLNLRENAIKAIPLSSKVIELVFGKLPGILTEHSGRILTEYLKINKAIPIYDCHLTTIDLWKYRLKKNP